MSQLLIDLVIGGVAALSVLGVGFVCGLCAGRRSVPVNGATPDSRRRPWKAEGPELQRLLSGWHDVRPRLAELATKVRELKQPPKEALAAWRTDLVRVTSDLRRALKDQLRGTDVIARPRVVDRSAAHK